MSYIVLARKYRPQNFKEVYAQEHVTEILQSAISSSRIAHAYLFTGPRGVGKTSLARIMAKSLNCVNGPTTEPCNICSNCTEITSGTSTDVIEIDGASNTSVDDIRELQRELLYAPSGSNYKIYIIDEVHMLSKNAFNALLKTLEEPPDKVVFIFATTEPHKVLPTIISRCQRYDFKRIPIEAIVSRLQDISRAENITIDNESLYLIARKADGGMRDALSLMDQAISYCMDNIKIDKVRQIFGLIPNQLYYELMMLIKDANAQELIGHLHSVFDQGIDLQEFINNMLEFLRVLILRKLGVAVQDVNPDELSIFDELAQIYNQNKLMYMMSYLIACKTDLKTSSNPYLILEALMIKLCRMDEMEDVAKLITKLSEGSPINYTTAAAPPQRQTPQQYSKPQSNTYQAQEHHEEEAFSKMDCNQENIDKLWPRIVARIRKHSSMCALALDKALAKEAKGRHLLLTLDSPTTLSSIKMNQDKINAILSELFLPAPVIELSLVKKESPTKVDIHRRTLDDVKAESPEIAKFIELTDSILSQ